MERHTARLYASTALLSFLSSPVWSANPAPIGDSYYYYEIGGAKATLGALNPDANPRPLTASSSFSLGYSCGKLAPLLSVRNFLDRARQGADDVANQADAAARIPSKIGSRYRPRASGKIRWQWAAMSFKPRRPARRRSAPTAFRGSAASMRAAPASRLFVRSVTSPRQATASWPIAPWPTPPRWRSP